MNDLIEGRRRSKLTFVASRESTARVEVDRLRRVREPVSRSKSGVQGKVADVTSGAPGMRNHKTNSRHSAFCWPRHIRMPGRSSRSFSNTTTMGQGIGTHQTFSLFGARIRKLWKSRTTPKPIDQRTRHALP